jgi:hypothetical protein
MALPEKRRLDTPRGRVLNADKEGQKLQIRRCGLFGGLHCLNVARADLPDHGCTDFVLPGCAAEHPVERCDSQYFADAAALLK